MKFKTIFILLISLVLIGCAEKHNKINTETVIDTYKMSCPVAYNDILVGYADAVLSDNNTSAADIIYFDNILKSNGNVNVGIILDTEHPDIQTLVMIYPFEFDRSDDVLMMFVKSCTSEIARQICTGFYQITDIQKKSIVVLCEDVALCEHLINDLGEEEVICQ